MSVLPAAPHGRLLTAMVTPFLPTGELDVEGAQRLAIHLLARGSDGLVLSGTTGESPTTSDAEQDTLLRAVREAVGDDVPLLAGVGTYDTAHTVELAQAAEKAGASGLLLVSPYYNRPPQAGLIAHVHAVAEASGLPIMLYDIPIRTGVAFETDTLATLAEHPRVVSVKDAKGDYVATSWLRARTDLAIYSGDDVSTLPILALGGVGLVSVAAHLVGRELATLIARFDRGDPEAARTIHLKLMPVFQGLFRTQGVIMTKAALGMLGLPAGPVRLPLVDATPEQCAQLRADLIAGGVSTEPAAILG